MIFERDSTDKTHDEGGTLNCFDDWQTQTGALFVRTNFPTRIAIARATADTSVGAIHEYLDALEKQAYEQQEMLVAVVYRAPTSFLEREIELLESVLKQLKEKRGVTA